MPDPQPLDPSDLETPTHDSSPTLPIPDAVKVRCGELAEQLKAAKASGYVEANVVKQLFDLVNDLMPVVFARLGI